MSSPSSPSKFVALKSYDTIPSHGSRALVEVYLRVSLPIELLDGAKDVQLDCALIAYSDCDLPIVFDRATVVSASHLRRASRLAKPANGSPDDGIIILSPIVLPLAKSNL